MREEAGTGAGRETDQISVATEEDSGAGEDHTGGSPLAERCWEVQPAFSVNTIPLEIVLDYVAIDLFFMLF